MPETSWNQHLSDDQMERYSLGRLADVELDVAEEHLLMCDSCQHRLAELDEYHSTMRAGLGRLSQEAGPQRHRSRWSSSRAFAAIAAGLVIVAIGIPVLQRSGAPQVVELSATRSSQAGSIAADRPTDLRLAATGLEAEKAVKVEVVDLSGRVQWSGSSTLENGSWTVRLDPIDKGNYWVRIYGANASEPLREYALSAQ